MGKVKISGVELTPLKRISHPKGDILHALKENENTFNGFGEAYFSMVNYEEIKGWNKHLKMTLNLIVPVGNVRFVIYDNREHSKTFDEYFSIELGENNYQRLTVSPHLWMAFKGLNSGVNLILNIADFKHEPDEVVKADLKKYIFQE